MLKAVARSDAEQRGGLTDFRVCQHLYIPSFCSLAPLWACQPNSRSNIIHRCVQSHIPEAVLRRWRRGRGRGRGIVAGGGCFEQALLHVEGQFLGLAGEHFGQLEEGEEEHDLQVLTGHFLAFLGGGLGTASGFTGGIDGHPGVLEVGGVGDDLVLDVALVAGQGGDEDVIPRPVGARRLGKR